MTNEQVTYSAIYANGSFEKITLQNLINKGGAAGKIFEVKEHQNLVAKIFHKISNSKNNREKLQAMLLNRPNFSPAMKNGKEYIDKQDNYIQIAWPEALLENEQGYCVGYLMPIINMDKSASLDHFMQKAIRQKLKLSEKYDHRLRVAYNLSAMVAALHQKGHYIVDLKPSNVFIYKESMLVSMLDCDGFSILGKHNRYPAEFVSEEYIYPEGMTLSCAEMGEEQDKFALAVIIFKLLNNGIHPYSGTPRKANSSNLTIQERITNFHYAYGEWADFYQSPHPYSQHHYFDKKTLAMFDRAFVKGLKRPTANEWHQHLRYLLQNLRQCKKNHNHSYFTSKGCGQCFAEEKVLSTLSSVKSQLSAPRVIRGVELDSISIEQIEKEKETKLKKNKKNNYITLAASSAYVAFWSFFYKATSPLSKILHDMGIGLQAILIIFIMLGINKSLKKLSKRLPFFGNDIFATILQVYALICMIISLFANNNISQEIILLAK